MRIDLSSLEQGARTAGEAFLPLLASEGARLGLNAWASGEGVLLELEAQLRLLPPRAEVDVAALRGLVDKLAVLADEGFCLRHYEDGWVVATRAIDAADLERAVDRARTAFSP
jgi:hypothetical protein